MSRDRIPFILRGWPLALLVASLLIATKTAPVFAHAELLTAEPAPGTKLYQSPAQIRLTFGEPVAPASNILVFGTNFQMVDNIQMRHDATQPEQLVADIPPLSVGQYTVQWQAISVDGDVVSGSYAFRITGSLFDAISQDDWLRGGIVALFGLIWVIGIIRWRRQHKPVRQPRNKRTSSQKDMTLLPFILLIVMATATACQSVKPPPTPLPTATPDPVVLGQQVFARICSVCHGENAEGYANALNAPALDETEHAYEHPDPVIHDWIVNGKLGLGRQMPALGEQLTDEEVHAVIAYLQTLWTEEQLAIQQDLSARWPATPEPTWTPQP